VAGATPPSVTPIAALTPTPSAAIATPTIVPTPTATPTLAPAPGPKSVQPGSAVGVFTEVDTSKTIGGRTVPPDVGLTTMTQDPISGFVRVYIREETTDFNFTLRVVAIDAAGNESAPQTVVVEHHDSGCSIGGTRISRPGLGWIALAALMVIAHRRRRR